MVILIVALGHKKQVGKSLAASLLKEHYADKKVEVVSFAGLLYDTCHKLFGVYGFQNKDYYDIFNKEKETVLPRLGKSPRQILIEIGCFMRKIKNDIWIDNAIKDHDKDTIIIIPDCRFPNEAEAIKAYGGLLIKIDRRSQIISDDEADCVLDGHPWFDYIVNNDGTPEELLQELVRIIDVYLQN